MSSKSSFRNMSAMGGGGISILPRDGGADRFEKLFKEGMALVDAAAVYLEGEGRSEAKKLKPPLSVLYATESMRLTTRLLEVASWLLIQRALREGQITPEVARKKRERVRLRPLGRPSHVTQYEELPAGLRRLIEASFTLNDRIVAMERAPGELEPSQTLPGGRESPVAAQMAMLRAAFERH